MSPAVPADLSGTAVAKALERGGFEHISTRGSHAKYRSGERTVIVPLHREQRRQRQTPPWRSRGSGTLARPPATLELSAPSRRTAVRSGGPRADGVQEAQEMADRRC